MCGICGYVGQENATPIIYEGLSRLEYRGYDSAGIATLQKGTQNTDEKYLIKVQKSVGALKNLGKKITKTSINGTIGIGHTRWATHGGVYERNAHPHVSFDNSCAVVHNGILENFIQLKTKLIEQGITFYSDTDTEVITHLLAQNYNTYRDESMKDIIVRTTNELQGTYGLLILHKDYTDTLFGVCHGSPLVIGKKSNAMVFASDAAALRKHSNEVIYLEEGEIAELTKNNFSIYNKEALRIEKKTHILKWNISEIEKGNFNTFMEKEIHEHPTAVRNAILGRVDFAENTALLSGMNISYEEMYEFTHVKFISIGTSLYSAHIGALLVENIARIPASAEMSSEFVCRNPVIDDKTLYIVVSQSGETYDTILALREIKNRGIKVRGICNVVGSAISRETYGGTFTHSGVEIAVASTKAFTGQLAVLYLLALKLARVRTMSVQDGACFIENLQSIPQKIEKIFAHKDEIKRIAKKYATLSHVMYLGRGLHYPVAMEAALKLKEVSYINANAYSASEMKHGPIALVDKNFPSIFLAPDDYLSTKMINSMQEIKARGGPIIVITSQDCTHFDDIADDIMYVPKTHSLFYPFLMTVPTHLFAMYIAMERKCDIDKPRNLAKTVTVE